jgi:hypothetical protein
MKNLFVSILAVIIVGVIAPKNSISQTNRWDTIFVANNSVNNKILASTSNGSEIFIGGVFTSAAGQTTNYIAKWNGTNWDTVSNDLNGRVYALAIFEGKLVAGGEFTTAGSTILNHIGVFDGTNWTTIGTGTNGNVYAINVRDEFIYFGGEFTNVNGNATNNIASYSILSGLVKYPTGPDGSVYAINSENGLFAGGAFTTSNGISTPYIAKFDGTNWNALATSVNDTVRALEYFNSMLFVGGDFTQAGALTETGCACWDNSVWKTAGGAFNNDVYALKLYNGILYAGGIFDIASTKPAKRIAQWNGTFWNNMGGGLDSSAFTITGMERDVYIGGVFQNAELFESKFFARWGAFPLIITEPTNQELCEGENLTLEIVSESSVPQTYRWYLNGVELVDSTNSTLNFSSISSNWSGTYYCDVYNQFGHAISSSFDVVVNEHVALNSQISDTASCLGNNIKMYVSASGTNNTYHWYKDGTLINWAIDDTIHLYNLTNVNAGIYYCKISNFCDTVISANINLTLNSIPAVSFTGLDAEYCSNDEATILTGTPTGGVFSGNGISGTEFNPNYLSGFHTIVYNYTDINGCSNSSTQITDVKYVTAINFTGLDAAYCINSEADTLTPNPTGGTFTGNGITDSIFSPVNAGVGLHTITYQQIQGNGCTAIYNQNVVVQNPDITIGNDTTICFNNPLNLTIVGDTGTYIWSTGETTQSINITPSSETTYYAYITTLGGCKDTAQITVSVNQLPIVTINPIENLYCTYSQQDTLEVSPLGGVFTGNGLTQNIFNPQLAGEGNHEIIYTYTDSNLCSNADTVYANVQTTSQGGVGFIGLGMEYCSTSDAVTLMGIPSGGSFFGEGIVNNTFNPTQTPGEGIYFITYVVETDSTCGSAYSQPVRILPNPEIFTSNDTSVCKSEFVDLKVWGETGTYQWSTGDTTQEINTKILTNRTIYVTLTATNGCQNNDSIYISLRQAILLGINADTALCRGESYNAPEGFSYYKWDYNALDGSLITPLETGAYKIYVVDSFGCPSFDTLNVTIKPTPSVYFDESYTLFSDQSIILGTSSNFDIYYWNNGSDANEQVFNAQDLQIGQNQIWLFVSLGGCTASDTTIINVLDDNYVENIYNNNNVQIFPNPATYFTIIHTSNKNLINSKIEITDITGKIIQSASINNLNTKIDVSNLENGIYFVKIIDGTNFLINKLIIEK